MWIENLRSAYRSLRSAPGFTVTAILSLGIGIGGSVAMFTLVNSIVLKPLAYPEAGQLLLVTNSTPKTAGVPVHGLLPVQFLRWRRGIESVESIAAAARAATANLSGSGQPETLGVMRITGGFFDTLKVQPQRGRWFTESEEKRGMPNVAILSDALWRNRFSADPNIIGRKIILSDVPYEVIGITPPDLRLFRGRQLHPMLEMPERTDVFMPLRFSAQEEQGYFNPGFVGIARLKPGVTLERALAEFNATPLKFGAQFGFVEFGTGSGAVVSEWRVAVQALQTALVGDVRKGLLLLFFSVGLVLLIACANVANLSLVRATQRSRELAIRAAIGARRGDLIRYSLTESFLLALGGTATGSIFSMWMTYVMISRAPASIPRLEETAADANVFAFAVAVCALTTFLFGLLPAWRASHVDPQQALNAAGRGSTDTRRVGLLRSALVTAEVALGTVLVIGSGLLLMSFQRVIHTPRGFDGGDILTTDIVLPTPRYQAVEKQTSFFRAVHDGIGSIPGVLSVAANSRLPLAFESLDMPIPEGFAIGPDNRPPLVAWPSVSADYFAAMKIPLRAGRLFRDEGEPEPVAVVSESAARFLWPGENPLGKRFTRPFESRTIFWRVIGVAGDVLSAGLDRSPTPAIYRVYGQQAGRTFSIVIRSALPADTLAKPVREAVWRVDPDIPVPELHTMPAVIAKSVQPRRFQASLLSAFALVAVLLAAIGIYGVVSYSVAQRRKEIGVRIALGARHRDVGNLVFRNGMAPVFLGLGVGLVAAALLARLIASLLFHVSPLNPLAYLAAPLILVIAAALPCWVTARQASRIDPVVALRLE